MIGDLCDFLGVVRPYLVYVLSLVHIGGVQPVRLLQSLVSLLDIFDVLPAKQGAILSFHSKFVFG